VFQLDASAKAPWTSTIVGLEFSVASDIQSSCLTVQFFSVVGIGRSL
jgi:hypothetical protein